MYKIDHCPACNSLTVHKEPAYLHQFLAWRINDEYVWDNMPINSLKCRKCRFVCTESRLNIEEEFKMYHNYRGEEYTNMREYSQPWYKDIKDNFTSRDAIKARTNGMDILIDRNVDIATISTVLDYGGFTGLYDPLKFMKAKRYVYNIFDNDFNSGFYKFDIAKNKSKVDFLYSSYFLDHVSDLDEYIFGIKRLMSKDTWLYMEVANDEESQVRIFNEQINCFTFSSLQMLLLKHNIEIKDNNLYNGYLCIMGKLKE